MGSSGGPSGADLAGLGAGGGQARVATEHQDLAALDVDVANPSDLFGHLSQLKRKMGMAVGFTRDLSTACPAIKGYHWHGYTLASVTRSGWSWYFPWRCAYVVSHGSPSKNSSWQMPSSA
jgi:hypothetical protein